MTATAKSIVNIVRQSANAQSALNNVLDAVFSGLTGSFVSDDFDAKNPPFQNEQANQLALAIATLRNGKSKERDLAQIRVMASRWPNKPEGYRVSIKTGTKTKPNQIGFELVENKKPAGSKVGKSGAPSSKSSGKSGVTVKATLKSLIDANDWDMQDVFDELVAIYGIKPVITEAKVFIGK